VVVEEEREHGVDGESVISLYKMFWKSAILTSQVGVST
jgi:hypothetical protein